VRPTPLALSLGDPAGVGPEIAVKAWQALRDGGPPFLVIGDFHILAAASPAGAAILARVGSPHEAMSVFARALPVLDMPLQGPVVSGKPSPANAPMVVRWIETAVGLALSGAVCGVVTAPIAKAPLYEAGFRFPGHTEFLDELTAAAPFDGRRGPIMMLASGDLRTTLVTIHQPYAEVPALLSRERIVRTAEITAQALSRDFGVMSPRLALAGLNPHAGESGMIGREEVEVITPAAEELRAKGYLVSGPRPADSLFHAEARLTYDAAVCMYHDQALIPVKMLDFWGGVNITLGLPVVRTSPDHGVGFDIAGRGLARADSLIAAVRMAADIADRRAGHAWT
jgi:4-hydroxythreonine-4-phosphate dehydrogenase